MTEKKETILRDLEEAIASNRIILPSLPEVALRVRELSAREDCSYAELEKEIAKDAAISARLLKVANSSALYTGGKPLTSIRQAITRLGLGLVRSLVTQLCILQTMQDGMDKEQLRGFVASSLRISAICHTLATKLSHLDAEQAALAGLLHDIGKLTLRQYLGQHHEYQLDEQQARQIELQLHPAVGGILLQHWKLPPELVSAAQEHEEMERDPAEQADYADLVIAANLLHYGTESGRYAHLADKRIPAMEKCSGNTNDERWETALEKRLEMSLSLINA